jgi:CelD/BcsL family acetyltransferase involved in cellulose biosynthesis
MSHGGVRLVWSDDIEAARAAWQRLAGAGRNIFATWEWSHTWLRHLAPSVTPMIAAGATDGSRPAVLVPLYCGTHGGVPALRLLGDGLGSRVGPIRAPGDDRLAAAVLAEAVATAPGRHILFVGESFPGEERWESVLPGSSHHREASPVLPIAGTSWEEYLASRSSNFRQQVRRRERRLRRGHDVSFRLADERSLDDDMETLFALHAARWSAGGSAAFAGSRKAFHREFSRSALARGWLRLWILELDGRAAAAWYGFRYGGVEWYYQSGRDPALDAESVGFVLMSHTIRAAIEDGMREYRFLLGDERYKGRFTGDDPGEVTVVAPTRPLGSLALRAALARRRSRRVLSRLIQSCEFTRSSTR